MKIFLIICSFLLISACASQQESKTVKQDTSVKTANPAAPLKAVIKTKTNTEYDKLNTAILKNNVLEIKEFSLELLQSNSEDLRALEALAMYYYKVKQFEAAKVLQQKALNIFSSSSGYNNLALIEVAMGHKAEAISLFQESLKFSAKNSVAKKNLAAIYAQEKDYKKVIFYLDQVVAQGQDDENCLNNFAIALTATDKINEASKIYEKILKTNPQHRNALLNYAILKIYKKSQFKEGLDLINRLKFVGADLRALEVIKKLEIRAKAGLK